MLETTYTLYLDGEPLCSTDAVIVVPSQAIDDPALIRLHCNAFDSSGKHTLYSLSQIAMIDYEDGLLQIIEVQTEQKAAYDVGRGLQTLDRGLILFRAETGGAKVLSKNAGDIKRLLKQTHRYCTRFIRLDVH
jgi:hypothetical protein